MAELRHVLIFTDGACIGNPGPGGYGVVLKFDGHRKEISAGYRKTTNNRMELLAAIAGLTALKERCRVNLYSDSEYLVKAMASGWAKKWESNNWRRSQREKASNPDLWSSLLQLCDYHVVEFLWVKGHAGEVENERCDKLAMAAAQQHDLLIDENYERSYM